MPRITQETINNTQVILKKTKVFTIDQLTASLSCSTPRRKNSVNDHIYY